jgi:uncharacterized protein YaeQ
MALTSTVFAFDIDLSDLDREVFENLSLRVARHPSESDEFLAARVLAYCLEYADGITFSRGLSDPDDPPLMIRDLTGALTTWIDIGTPTAERLHRASKAAPRVALYVHKDPRQWLAGLRGSTIHRREALMVRVFEPRFVQAFASRLKRRMSMAVTISDGQMTLAFDDGNIEGEIGRLELPGDA